MSHLPQLLTDPFPENAALPIIQLVEQLFNEAQAQHASDIHLEPFAQYGRIRLRIDGLLYESKQLPKNIFIQIIGRLKILAHLNIAETRLPQDGRLPLPGKNIEIRINTCPTIFGEKIVLRLAYVRTHPLSVFELGMMPNQLDLFLKYLRKPQGLILITGPTGSGKTSSLYAALRWLNCIEKNILSIEDPVEVHIPGITQVNIHPKIGLDFANSLRANLRQDPDIIMVGEIRDRAGALVTMQAALTGHLVLSTVHSNSIVDTFSRLRSLQLPLYQLLNSLSLVISQRLIRLSCPICKNNKTLDCSNCHNGYLGRIGIFEILALDENILLKDESLYSLLNHIKQMRYLRLSEVALKLVNAGKTTLTEVERVLG